MEIADWRKKIDELDEQIVNLLNERAACAIAIGEIKRKDGAAIYEPQREQQVIAHARNANAGPLADEQIKDIYERIMDIMRSLQRPDHGIPAGQQKQPVAGSKG
jgi:chorismate mutase